MNMASNIIAVTRTDLQRIKSLLHHDFVASFGDERTHLRELARRLACANVVESREMLPDVVTMNSTFKLFDLIRKESDTFTLVYPDEACIAEGKLSILSPLGTEVFGRRVGESLSLQVLSGETRKRVEQIFFQPERCGAFNL
ncbi:Regulator of nucleoside diphosphate kinase [Rubripirellula obstinata]|uniref:Regulator of nucleoside diphosphate kinase n=1 Tax=Rubripirellula obstinata TaxID=406547 RepID=A0A5B1CQ76_9BACT|nr:GreA/GreB family elongation factor [Rubripirellula obstinata]KAA1262009.1 Regulator of nucleoside diphosphate kinase [Rubripirellula obstinata]